MFIFSIGCKLISKTWVFVIIYTLCFLPVNGANNGPGGKSGAQESHSQHSVKVGERLFHGLIQTGDQTIDCASCHYTNQIDTLNWNPSALAIAKTTKDLDSTEFANRLFNNMTQAGMTAHENVQLTGEQVKNIRAYLDHIRETGLREEKPVVTELLIFIGLVLVILLLIADMAFFKVIKTNAIHFLLITAAGVGIVKILYTEAVALDRMQGYEPQQPIKFSHKVHAGDNQIDCMYCHTSASHSKSAGLPGASLCMNCHEVIMEGPKAGDFEINKITRALEDSMPIEWVRIHQLPDHAFFSHAQHVEVGGLDCQECHGPVEEMHVMRQHAELSMGWCLDCHRTMNVDMIENDYYQKTFEEYHQDLVEGRIDSVTVADIGGTDCMKCHY
jgi:hypothetical protein